MFNGWKITNILDVGLGSRLGNVHLGTQTPVPGCSFGAILRCATDTRWTDARRVGMKNWGGKMRTNDNRRERCWQSGKIKHSGRKQALTACSLAPVPLKPYKCPWCGYWHVTKLCPAMMVMG